MRALGLCGLLGAASALLVASPVAAQDGAPDAAATTGSDLRGAEEKIIVRFGVGYDLASGSLSGEDGVQGDVVNDSVARTTNQFATGDLALGTRGLGLSTLNSYVLVTTALDLDGNPAINAFEAQMAEGASAHPSVFNRYDGAQNVLVHSAYAELDGLTTNRDSALSHINLRAGRQFHWGVGAVTFDGATVGYNDGSVDVGLRFGRRSAVYNVTQDDPGLIGGVSAAYDLADTADVPLLLRLDFMHFQREVTLLEIDRPYADGKEKVDVQVDKGELAAYLEVGESGRLDARFSMLGADPSHAQLGAVWGFGDSALFIDFDQKLGPDLFYDIAGGPSKEVGGQMITYETYRLNIPDRQPFTDIQARLEIWPNKELAITPLGGYHLVLADAAERTAYDADRAFWGLGVRYNLQVSKGAGLELVTEYKGQSVTRDESVGDSFFSVASGAETGSHEISGGLEYARGTRFVEGRMLGGRTLTVGLGGFYRRYTLDNRYIDATAEDFVGAEAEVKWNASKYLGLKARYELARDSNVFARPFGNFNGVRAGVEGRF